MRYSISILLMLLLTAGLARSQTNTPSADQAPDYSTYPQFIAARNIFNPNRYPTRDNHHPAAESRSKSAPYFTLVGTMDYQKGIFAFFDGNRADYRKVLQANEHIADFVVTSITPAGVTLTATSTNAAQTNLVQMAIGSQLRQNGTLWEPATAEEMATSSSDNGDSSAPDNSSGSASSTTDSNRSSSDRSSSGSAPNDILKRLMQKRQQEMK